MNRVLYLGVVVTLFSLSGCALFESSSQSSESSSSEEPVVGIIDDEPVTLDELKTQYNKSNTLPIDADNDQGLEDFLELYMDYRLKLAVAKDAGYMEDPEILSDLEQYERQSAYPFWLEREVEDKLLDELYERSKELIHAQHILISVPEDASPSDTAQAYNALMEARERFLNGDDDFISLSAEYSSRQRGQSMGGDLGYFGAGRAVKSFEDVAYSLSEGEVSKPFRTRFGYHLLHVKDRKEAGPDKHFSHIFFRTRGMEEPIDSILARASQAYDELENGRTWDDVVAEYSQDDQSRNSGGTIGWVTYGRYEQAFTDTLMQIENTGDYTRPFTSNYGIHIARLDSVKHPSEKEKREELKEMLAQLPRYRENEQAVINHAAEVGNARFHRDNLVAFEEFVREADQKPFSSLTLPDTLRQKKLFSFNDKTWTIDEYTIWLKSVIDEQGDRQYHHSLSEEFRDHIVDAELITLTRRQFPEFSELSNDYLTGLAVFQVNEDSIWTYARQDTARLKELYEAEKDQYRYDTRYRLVRFSARDDSTLEQVREQVESGEPVDSIGTNITNVTVRRDIVSSFENQPYPDLSDFEEGQFSPLFEYQDRRSIMYLEEILEPRAMTFDEAYNKLTTDYQSIREKEWLESMRNKYQVEMFPEVLQDTLTRKDD